MKVTIMGAGSSSGVPIPGVGWGKCDPEHPKNQRLRPSILIDAAERRFLVDTSPDLRQQLLNCDVTRLDAVLYTHAHADHLNGLDDLRGINRAMHAPLDIYCDAPTLQIIKDRFGYALEPLKEGATRYYKPVLHAHTFSAGDEIKVAGVTMQTFDQDHGYSRTVGYRIGNFGYSTDLMRLPEEGFAVLEGVHTWVVGCFCNSPHETHVHVAKALEWIERVKPEQAVLSHLGPTLDFADLSARLPDRVSAAYDGMVIDIPD